ncbi:MAG: XRE family transcriptional regulator [Thiofilum sp.]|uniref:XRE family transcriptional regulator n=1 Tax=Thiofilum sp. TaxID=2212733 RepID=UPI0025F57A21|nr:XRE family transcriptional regulator [Thiofilum sp.]MBK8454347.1 ImmA/IrrE family metallo-endopeptidase [Thiofilum sp.]
MISNSITPTELGERLRIARESLGITQANAADVIKVARTTLVAIEKGQRKVRLEELELLAKLYQTSINALVRKHAVHIDLVPRFRKTNEGTEIAALNAANYLSNLVKAEVELETLLGITKHKNYPPERPILSGNILLQAETNALELRQWLGLGFSPIKNILAILEMDLGIRVYVRDLDPKISGLFTFDEKIGACILINAKHRYDRRTFSAAHELGHFISTRNAPEILIDTNQASREENYANAFARCFLTPSRLVTQKFQEITTGSSTLTRTHVISLAYELGVSREATVRRLEELELVRAGTWDWFSNNGGITDEQAKQVLGELYNAPYSRETSRPTSLRMNLLIAEVSRKNLLSEGQLARLLHIDRIELREILDALNNDGDELDDAPKLS